jgi:hypothetical protein
MRSTAPPKAARWILNHFGCSPNNAAVIGDLDERFNNGRSVGWYWQQVLVTVLVSFFTEIWNHKLRATLAVLTGWVALRVVSSGLDYFVPFTAPFWLLPRTLKYPDGWMVLLTWATFALTGWIVAKTQRSHRLPMVLIYAISFAIGRAQFVLVMSLAEWRGERYPGAYPVWLAVFTAVSESVSILVGGGIFTKPVSSTSDNSTELKSKPV